MICCKECGSQAINHRLYGRDGSDPDLCDVCYWRKRAEDKSMITKETAPEPTVWVKSTILIAVKDEPDCYAVPPSLTQEELRQVLEALKIDHEWHKQHDDYGRYPGSILAEINVKAIAILKGKLE